MNAENKREGGAAVDGRVDLEALKTNFIFWLPTVGCVRKRNLLNALRLIDECRDNRQKIEALTLERDDARIAYRDMKAVLRLTVDERDTARLAADQSATYAGTLRKSIRFLEGALKTSEGERHTMNLRNGELETQLSTAQPALPSDEPGETNSDWTEDECQLYSDCEDCPRYAKCIDEEMAVGDEPGETVAMVKCPNERCDRGIHRSGTEGHPGLSWTCETCKGKGKVPVDAET